ncbi:MAG: hypothetical protein ABW003_27585 [Microvirga sp.]
MVHKLAGRHGELLFRYEADPTGYGLQRSISAFRIRLGVHRPFADPRPPGRALEDQPP